MCLMRTVKILVRNLISMTCSITKCISFTEMAVSFTLFFTFSRVPYASSGKNEFDRVEQGEGREMVR